MLGPLAIDRTLSRAHGTETLAVPTLLTLLTLLTLPTLLTGLSAAAATGRSRSGLSRTAPKSGEIEVAHYCAPCTTRQRRFLW